LARVVTSLDSVQRLAFNEKADRHSLSSTSVDFSRKCSKPVLVELKGMPCPLLQSKRAEVFSWWDINMGTPVFPLVDARVGRSKHWIDMLVPCRKCEACLKARGRLWSERAFHEVRGSTRTWFCTYTLNPSWRVRAEIEASTSEPEDLYRVVSKWFTLYLKRLRKESGVSFRYLLVVELHKDGFPHLHALVHEIGGQQITKRQLQGQWPYGYTSVKLANPTSARYVTKYISKQAIARIRASLGYGRVLTQNTSYDILHESGGESFDPSSFLTLKNLKENEED